MEESVWDKIIGKNIKSPYTQWREEQDLPSGITPDSAVDSKGGSVGGADPSAVEGAGTAAAASSGNPYAMAASGGLKVLQMVAKRKEEERKAQYMAQLDHKDNIRGALDKLIGVSQGLRNL